MVEYNHYNILAEIQKVKQGFSRMKRKILKFIIISIFALPILFFVHTGFLTDSPIKNLQVILFTAVLGCSIVWSVFRKYILLISLCLIILMAILFILDLIYWADILGSTGIGLIIINLLSYLPQLIKLGYIKKL